MSSIAIAWIASIVLVCIKMSFTSSVTRSAGALRSPHRSASVDSNSAYLPLCPPLLVLSEVIARADLYNKEIEVIRDEQREDEAERLEQAKIELLHLEAKMREERRRRREEELLELVKDTKEDYVYVPPRGRPEYRTKQRDIDLTRISHDLRQRRDEQADRIKAREQERAKELNTYLRYSESEQKRKERIARMDAADAKEHERERADERATLDQRATERRTRREQEHEEARNKERRQRPIVDYDFDETGKVIHRPLRDQFKEEVKPSAAAVPKEETAKERRQRARQQQAAATAPTDVASSTAPLSAAVEKEVETKSTTVAEKEVETEAIPAPVVLATEAPSASVEVEVAAPSAVASVVVEAEAVAEPSLTVEIPLTPVTPDTPAAAAPESAQ